MTLPLSDTDRLKIYRGRKIISLPLLVFKDYTNNVTYDFTPNNLDLASFPKETALTGNEIVYITKNGKSVPYTLAALKSYIASSATVSQISPFLSAFPAYAALDGTETTLVRQGSSILSNPLLSAILAYTGGSVIIPYNPVLPKQSNIVYRMDPNTITGTADNAQISSYTDPTSGITATASANVYYGSTYSGPTKAGLYFSANAYLDLGRPAALTTPMSDSGGWSAMVIFGGAAASSTGTIFGDRTDKIAFAANTSTINLSGNAYNYRSGSGNTDIHTLIYSGDAGAGITGRMYVDGTMVVGGIPLSIGTNNLRIGGVPNAAGDNSFGYQGTICRMFVWNTKLSAAEALQAHLSARNYFDLSYPLTGMTFFPVFDGDSIPEGVGATPNSSFPELIALSKGWKLGAYANVGKPSAQVATGTAGGNNLVDSAARDIDQFHTMFNSIGVNLPIKIIMGEWYNQGSGTGTTGQGVVFADNNRTYAAARKTADPTATLVGWTSTTSYNKNGPIRDEFNLSLINNKGSFDTIIPIHTDIYVGTDAAAPPNNTGNTYFADGIHPNPTGAGKIRDFMLSYL